jgi:hypothetical protein
VSPGQKGGRDETLADVLASHFTALVAVKVGALARHLELRTRQQSEIKPYSQEIFIFETTYLETNMAEGLSVNLPGPCRPTTDVGGGAVALSSISLGVGVKGGTMVGASTGPRTTA